MDKIFKYFVLFCVLLVPGNLETCLHISNSNGNFATYGLFLGLYNKRNIIYFSLAVIIFGLGFKFKYMQMIGLFLFGFCVLKMLRDMYYYKILRFFEPTPTSLNI